MYKKNKEISGHAGAIYTSIFDGEFLYTGSADNFVTRWDIEDGTQDKFAIKMNQSVYALGLLDSDHLVVGLSTGSIHIFNLSLRQEIKHFTQHKKSIFSISTNRIKSHFYVGDAEGNVSIWNSVNFELLTFIPIACGKIRNIHVSENGDLFVLSCQDGTTRIFETVGFNEIITINSHEMGSSVAHFHPNNSNLLITGGKDAHLKIWNWKTSELIKNIPAHNFVIYDVCFIERNSKFITCSRDKTIKIWDSTDFNVLQKLDQKSGGHKHSVNQLTKLDENSFASVSDDKKIIVWEN